MIIYKWRKLIMLPAGSWICTGQLHRQGLCPLKRRFRQCALLCSHRCPRPAAGPRPRTQQAQDQGCKRREGRVNAESNANDRSLFNGSFVRFRRFAFARAFFLTRFFSRFTLMADGARLPLYAACIVFGADLLLVQFYQSNLAG